MAFRLVEAFLPTDQEGALEEALEGIDVQGVWKQDASEDLLHVRVLVEVEGSDSVVGALTERFEGLDGFQAFLVPVEASLPPPPEEDEKEETGDADGEGEERKQGLFRTGRVSVEELLSEVRDMSRLTPVYMAMVGLATIVAAIGLLQDSVAVVIGSMVIAPLLGPIVALSLATTLADWSLGRHALKTNVAGLSVAFGLAVAIGIAVSVDPEIGEIARRTDLSLADVALGLAVGGAGVLSVTTGVSTALVGVMVAVALLPPLVVFGLLVGAGTWPQAAASGILLLTYAIAINLSAVIVFRVQGVKPRQAWEEERARRAARWSIVLWFFLLAALAALIWLLPIG